MRPHKKIVATTLSICLAVLSACGGGGGSGGGADPRDPGDPRDPRDPINGGTGIPTTEASRNLPVNFAVDASELRFAAAGAAAATPRPQQVLAFFENYSGKLAGDVFLRLTLSGAAVGESSSVVTKITIAANGNVSSGSDSIKDVSVMGVGNILNTDTLTLRTDGVGILSVGTRVAVQPLAPSAVGVGRFTGTATLRACVGDSTCATGEVAGSPRTINISYVVDPVANGMVSVMADAVMPRIQPANILSDVVIRSPAVSGVTAVRFGNVPATNVTVVSDTEVRARMPAMAAGTYSVSLNNGTVPFSGSVQVVAPMTATAEVLDYQGIDADRVMATVYDDAHQALLVALAAVSPADNKVLRYTRTAKGEWTGAVFSVPNLNDLTIANDGSRLLGVTDTAVLELTLDTLTALRTVPAPASLSADVRFERLALGNDGKVVITTSNGSVLSPGLLYSPSNGSFSPLNNAGQLESGKGAATLVAAADGSRIFITPSVRDAALLHYESANGVVGTKALSIHPLHASGLAIDQNATRMIAFDELAGSAEVRDGNFAVPASLGREGLASFITRAALINRAGTRAVALEKKGDFYFFDLTAPTVNGVAAQVGSPLALNFKGDGAIRTAVSADGRVAFFASANGVAVVPVPN